MADSMNALLTLIGLIFAVSCCAAGSVIAVAMTCRWLGWAPVNMTVNIHNHYPDPDQ